MTVKVNIIAELKISCYNCLYCKEHPKINTNGEDGHYTCSVDDSFIGGYHDGKDYESLCKGMFWKWDGDDRGQKTLEDCDLRTMKVSTVLETRN